MRSLLAVLAVAVFAPVAHAADDPLLAPAGACDAATPQQTMVCLTNYARTQSGLQALRPNTTLDAAGDAKLAADMSCAEFSHTPCGNPFQTVFASYLAGAAAYSIGENIAWGTDSYGTPRETMNSWLHSPGHRANILAATFTELGIGFLPNQTFQGYGGATLWSQEFGTRSAPLVSAPPVSPTPKKHHRRPARRRLTLR